MKSEFFLILLEFSPRWLNEDLLESAIMTLDDYFQELKSTIASPIYFNRVVKLCFEKLFSFYFDYFLYSCQLCFNCCIGFNSEDLSHVLDRKNNEEKNQQENEKKPKKKEKEKLKSLQQQNLMAVFTNKENLLEKIKKEKNFFIEKANEKFLNIVGKTGIEKIDKTLKVFADLLKITRGDLESSFPQVFESFQAKGIYIVESILFIREDVDAQFKKEILRKYQDFISKQHK